MKNTKLEPYMCGRCKSSVRFKDYINIGTVRDPAWVCRVCADNFRAIMRGQIGAGMPISPSYDPNKTG